MKEMVQRFNYIQWYMLWENSLSIWSTREHKTLPLRDLENINLPCIYIEKKLTPWWKPRPLMKKPQLVKIITFAWLSILEVWTMTLSPKAILIIRLVTDTNPPNHNKKILKVC